MQSSPLRFLCNKIINTCNTWNEENLESKQDINVHKDGKKMFPSEAWKKKQKNGWGDYTKFVFNSTKTSKNLICFAVTTSSPPHIVYFNRQK